MTCFFCKVIELPYSHEGDEEEQACERVGTKQNTADQYSDKNGPGYCAL